MRGLDDLVRAGKVLYVGISDAPAWVVSASNVLADLRGMTPFTALQIEYSLLERTVERDLLPMAEHFDLSVLAWAPLAAGVLTGKYTRGGEPDTRRKSGNESRGRLSGPALDIARKVDTIADELGATSAQVATAWVRSHGYRYIPILGARTVAQIEDTLKSVSVTLSDKHLAELHELSKVDLDFPHKFLASDAIMDTLYGEVRTRIDPR